MSINNTNYKLKLIQIQQKLQQNKEQNRNCKSMTVVERRYFKGKSTLISQLLYGQAVDSK